MQPTARQNSLATRAARVTPGRRVSRQGWCGQTSIAAARRFNFDYRFVFHRFYNTSSSHHYGIFADFSAYFLRLYRIDKILLSERASIYIFVPPSGLSVPYHSHTSLYASLRADADDFDSAHGHGPPRAVPAIMLLFLCARRAAFSISLMGM